jgi:hypothetical protein
VLVVLHVVVWHRDLRRARRPVDLLADAGLLGDWGKTRSATSAAGHGA